jgi:hypothetical protein
LNFKNQTIATLDYIGFFKYNVQSYFFADPEIQDKIQKDYHSDPLKWRKLALNFISNE